MALLVGVGAVLFWPALTTSFFLDDYLQSAMVHGRFPGIRGPFALYDFVADDNRQALFEHGFLPWWTDPALTLRFLRPLSSALLFYEHTFIGAHPFVMHLHSFAWWVAAVFAARSFFRRCVTPRAAAFATVMFALAPCHALPIGWLANREALISLTFGTLGLTGLLRWQRGDGARWAALSFLAFSVALAAGEYALACGGFVVAFVWRGPPMRPGTATRRGGLWLFAVPSAAYLIARGTLGYGAVASGFYQDPLRDTWLFLRHVPWRLASLTLWGWFSQDPSTWRWGDMSWPVGVAAGLGLFGLRAALLHVTATQQPEARKATWTLVWGVFLSLFPLLAVVPSVRLVGVPMLGIAPVVGVMLEAAWFARETEARHGVEEWTAIAATLLGFAHLVHGPGRGYVNARQIHTYAAEFEQHASELAKRVEGRVAPEIVVVRGLDDIFVYGFALEALGVHDPRLTVLTHTGHVLCLRTDDDTLDIHLAADSGMYPVSVGDLYRGELRPAMPGDVFTTATFAATVTDVTSNGPRAARFQFSTDLDDPRRMWVGESRTRGFYDAPPPKVGFGEPFDP